MKKLIGEGFLQLKSNDLIKGFITAMLTVIVTYVGQALDKGEFPMDSHTWILEFKIALGAGIAYLIKNFFTNNNPVQPNKEDGNV
jgi:hypothetical protein